MFNKHSSVFVILIVVLSMIHADKVKYDKCESEDTDADNSCTVSNVEVDKCEKSDEKDYCTLKIGTNVTISFDYVSKFDAKATNDSASIYLFDDWQSIPGAPMGECKFSACPLKKKKKGTAKINIEIPKSTPTMTSFVLLAMEKSEKEYCCVMVPVKLEKK